MHKRMLRRTQRTLAAALCLGSLAAGAHAAASVSPVAEVSCTARVLDSVGQYTSVKDSSSTGRWLTGLSSSGIPFGDPIPVWHDGVVTPLSAPAQLAYAGGINNRGVLAGYLLPDFGIPQVAFAQDGETLIPLDTPARVQNIESTRGISDAGLIGGTGSTATGRSVPIVWSLDRPDQPRVLRVPDGESAEVVDVSGSGLIGIVVGSGLDTRSVLVRPSGQQVAFPTTAPNANVAVRAVGNDWAVGQERNSVGEVYIVRYSLATGVAERLDIPSGAPTDINSAGWVVGNDADGAFLFTDHVIRLPNTAPSNVSAAYTIDDRGRPGGSLNSELFWEAAYWTCNG